MIETHADPVFRDGDSSAVAPRASVPRPTDAVAVDPPRLFHQSDCEEFQNLNVLVPSSAVVTSTPSSVSLLASSMHASISSTSPDI